MKINDSTKRSNKLKRLFSPIDRLGKSTVVLLASHGVIPTKVATRLILALGWKHV
jgi:hypothetical protein